jgi:CRP-like cAMP-binding protein
MNTILYALRDPGLVEAGVVELCRFDAGANIVTEGESGRALYLIESGQVRVSERVQLEDRRHIRPGLCDLGPGEVFGELGLFEAAPRTATVTALETCDLRVIDAERLVAYMDANPALGYAVLRELFLVLGERLRQADRRLASLFAWGLKAHGIDRSLGDPD